VALRSVHQSKIDEYRQYRTSVRTGDENFWEMA
jgi:hypothetical protein